MPAGDPDCVFCKIVSGTIPCLKVHEEQDCLAFLDIGPLAEGHTLLIPKQHYRLLDDMPADLVGRITAQLPRLGAAVRDVTEAQGYNILQNNGKAAGQEVAHVHFHIIPRREGDGLGYRWLAGRYDAGRGEQLQQLLLRSLSA